MIDPKTKEIVINNFQKGIAPSSAFGFQEIRGLNITDKPGFIYPNRETVKDSGSTITGLIQGWADEDGTPWGYDSNDNVYERTGQDTWEEHDQHDTGGINGIQYWKGYVFIFRSNDIDLYDPSDGSCIQNWPAGNSITSDGITHPSIHAQDDVMYIGAGRYLDKIEEDTTFDPTDAGTYTISKATLTLLEGEDIQDLLELGDKMMIVCENKIYPWDYSSSDIMTPVRFNKDIQQAIVYNNLIYVQAGYKGEWYVTNGTTVQPVARIPETLIEIGTSQLVSSKPIIKNELIYFGLGSQATLHPVGIYSLNPRTGAINLEHLISTDGDGTSNQISFGPLFNLGTSSDFFLAPWQEDTDYGVDRLSGNQYDNDEPFLISQFYRVASKPNTHNYKGIEIQLDRPLESDTNDSLKVYYRTALDGSWTLLKTFDTDEAQSYNSLSDPEVKPPIDIENTQFKIILNGDAELAEFRCF